MFDLLLGSGTVIYGSGAPGFGAEVAVQDGRMVADASKEPITKFARPIFGSPDANWGLSDLDGYYETPGTRRNRFEREDPCRPWQCCAQPC